MATSTTRLALARLAAGFQQREFAELAQLSPTRLCEYERGVRPPASRRAELAATLGYEAHILFPEQLAVREEDVRRWLDADHDHATLRGSGTGR